jgi:uncharacterized RDD family membrane protein YckC
MTTMRAELLEVTSLATQGLALVPLLGWGFALVDPLFVFGDDRRTLHDRIADTIVVDLRASPAAPKPVA